MFEKKGFIKDAATLTAGTAIAQFVPILVYPILSRRFSPENFAVLATFTSIVNILQVLITGKFEDGIFITKNEKDTVSLTSLAVIVSLLVGLLSFFFFLLFGGSLGNSIESLGGWLLLTPLVAFCVCIYNVYNEWCVRKKDFNKLSLNKMTYSFSTTAGKLCLSFGQIRSIGLLLGDIIGKILTAFVCFFRVMYSSSKQFRSITFKDLKYAAVQNRKFPMYIMPAQLLNTIGGSFPVLLLGTYYNQVEVGYYSMTTMVLSIPISIISYSIRDVFRQRANEEYQNRGEFKSMFYRLFFILSGASIGVCAAVVWILPVCFKWVLGTEWLQAGVYAQILLPMIAVDFVAMSLSGVFVVVGKLNVQLIWQIVYCISTILVFVIGGKLFSDIKMTLILFSISRVFVYGLLIGLSAHYSKGEGRRNESYI